MNSSKRLENILCHLESNPCAASKPTTLSSHCLDLVEGRPANGLSLELSQKQENGSWKVLAKAVTNQDGRVTTSDWGVELPEAGDYVVRFLTEGYFKSKGITQYLYTEIPVQFRLKPENLGKHYHIPLLLSPFGYSTYRGS